MNKKNFFFQLLAASVTLSETVNNSQQYTL